MPDKMLKFVKIGQQNPPKREVDLRKVILTRYMTNLLVIKLKSNQAGVLNAEFLLPGSLSFKQQYSRLAKTHCRGTIGRGISTITKYK